MKKESPIKATPITGVTSEVVFDAIEISKRNGKKWQIRLFMHNEFTIDGVADKVSKPMDLISYDIHDTNEDPDVEALLDAAQDVANRLAKGKLKKA